MDHHTAVVIWQRGDQNFLDKAYSRKHLLKFDGGAEVAMTQVTLRPAVQFSGALMPTPLQIDQMHHAAHEACYIANSVKTVVTCEPVN